MTRFEREITGGIKNGTADGIVILKERKAELDRLYKKGKSEKNGFRRDCIEQEYLKRKEEYDEISKLI